VDRFAAGGDDLGNGGLDRRGIRLAGLGDGQGHDGAGVVGAVGRRCIRLDAAREGLVVGVEIFGRRRRAGTVRPGCGDGYLLSLEDDAPVDSERAVFMVNISNPCWIWRGADLTKITSLRATVGQIPFNFQIGRDADKIPLPKPATNDGEFEVRLDNCEGPPLQTASLSPALSNNGLTVLPAIPLEGNTGTHDLCFRFTRSKIDPIWVIGSVELVGN